MKDNFCNITSSRKFIWFVIIITTITVLSYTKMLPTEDFVSIFKWAVFGLFGSEGLNELTNTSRTEKKEISDL